MDVEWISYCLEYFSWIGEFVRATAGESWRQLVALQAAHPELLGAQTLLGLLGWGLAVWKWWENREANLFRRFEEMIERNEAKLVKACSDLVDVINRPGPGIAIQAPLFVENSLLQVLARRKWSPKSLWPLLQPTDARLEATISTCDRKVTAHLSRLALFRTQIASAHLVQGALAAGRAAGAKLQHEIQRLDQEALDRFRGVLAIPGHKDNVTALELVAHQLARLDGQANLAINSYEALIASLNAQEPSPARNLLLARAKRCLAIVNYPEGPMAAQALLDEAIALMTEYGPPRDRDFLELAHAVQLDGIARLRLNQVARGPQRLSEAQGHYRSLIRHLQSRRRGLFRWMFSERKFAGHRVAELQTQAERGLSQVNHLIHLNNARQSLLIRSLRKGSGVPRQNRTRAH